MEPVRAGILYGFAGFFAGFVFGTLRELVLIPAFGVTQGHWIEFLPLVLVIAWLGSWFVRRYDFSRIPHAILFGLTGVCVLLVLESALAIFVFGQSVDQYVSGFNIFEGKLFPYGLAVMALAPVVFLFRRRVSE